MLSLHLEMFTWFVHSPPNTLTQSLPPGSWELQHELELQAHLIFLLKFGQAEFLPWVIQ